MAGAETGDGKIFNVQLKPAPTLTLTEHAECNDQRLYYAHHARLAECPLMRGYLLMPVVCALTAGSAA